MNQPEIVNTFRAGEYVEHEDMPGVPLRVMNANANGVEVTWTSAEHGEHHAYFLSSVLRPFIAQAKAAVK